MDARIATLDGVMALAHRAVSALFRSLPRVGLGPTVLDIADSLCTNRQGLGEGATNVVKRSWGNLTEILGGWIDFYWVEKRAGVGERGVSAQRNARGWRF